MYIKKKVKKKKDWTVKPHLFLLIYLLNNLFLLASVRKAIKSIEQRGYKKNCLYGH